MTVTSLFSLCLDEYSADDHVSARRHGRVVGVEAKVCTDISERQHRGIAKYGQTVAANPLDLRAWLQHAYEECLDQAVYLRRAIAEIDSKTSQ